MFDERDNNIINNEPKEVENTNSFVETGSNYTETQNSFNNTTQQEQLYNYTNQWQPGSGNFYQMENGNGNGNGKKEKKKKEKKAKKPLTGKTVLAASLATAVISVMASNGVLYYVYNAEIKDNYALKTQIAASNVKSTLDNISTVVNNKTEDKNLLTTSQITELVMPSVVAITSTSIVQSNYNPFMGGGSYQVTGAGSGIIVGVSDTELFIVTNNHVIEDTTSLSLEFSDGTKVDKAYVKGTNTTKDVAVVAVKIADLDDATMKNIKVATLGDSKKLTVGEDVVAIGNALGYGQSVTSGVVSAVNREITINENTMKVIQTDASINGGNSGGALINSAGEVIGINVAKASSGSTSSSSVEGMGYAIPITLVKDIITDLMNKEAKEEVSEDNRGYMGLTSCVDVDAETSKTYNIPEGVYIKEMVKGSPIDVAGINVNDVITKINGEAVKTYEEIKEQMKFYATGDEVTVTVQVRDKNQYSEKELKLKLISYKDLESLTK